MKTFHEVTFSKLQTLTIGLMPTSSFCKYEKTHINNTDVIINFSFKFVFQKTDVQPYHNFLFILSC